VDIRDVFVEGGSTPTLNHCVRLTARFFRRPSFSLTRLPVSTVLGRGVFATVAVWVFICPTHCFSESVTAGITHRRPLYPLLFCLCEWWGTRTRLA
jgi:hypothetical protein